MKTETYLGLIKKLNVLIDNKQLEKEELFTLATKVTQDNDGMPHAPGISDKVGNMSVKLMMKEEEINHAIDVYVDLKHEIISQIESLPEDEYDVLYDYYVLDFGLFDIASSRGQSVDWIKKLKWRSISKITVIESDVYKEACELLFSKKSSHL